MVMIVRFLQKKHVNHYIQVSRRHAMDCRVYYNVKFESPIVEKVLINVHEMQNLLWDITKEELDITNLM